jgi:DNA-binding MarR family transcriptional regulator
MLPSPPNDPRHCALRLRASVSRLTRELRSTLPPEGISLAKLSVLALLHRLGPLTPSELARRERVKLQSLTRLLAELEADGLVARAPHPADGRQSLLSLTRRAVKALTDDVHRREASLADAVAASLSTAERALLLQACALIDRVAQTVADAAANATAGSRA